MTIDTAIKFVGDGQTKIGGYAVVFGGVDLTGDFFDESTDLWLDRLNANPPILWNHGGDDAVGKTVVGRVTSTRRDDVGLWIEGVLDGSSKYLAAIVDLVNRGVIGFSTGSIGHLVERVAQGSRRKITSWPIAELSLTNTPAEPRTLGVMQLKALAATEPWLKSVLDDPAVVQARDYFAQLAVEFPSTESEAAHAEFAWIDAQVFVDDCTAWIREAREGEQFQKENRMGELRRRITEPAHR